MTTAELPRTRLSHTGLWCWQATLQAFGIHVKGHGAKPGRFTIDLLLQNGYRVGIDEDALRRPGTLARFIREHPTGDWLVSTRGHVMALRDGKLTDTDLTKGGRRQVVVAYKVMSETK